MNLPIRSATRNRASRNFILWTHQPLSEIDQKQIQKTINKQIRPNTLSEIPPLSNGLIERFISPQTTLNFIPSSWIEQQKTTGYPQTPSQICDDHRYHMASSYSFLHDLWFA